MNTMKEAFEASGVLRGIDRPEVPPYRRWWQNFRLPLTTFNIPVFLKVECDTWADGLRIIGDRNLNRLTTRCKDEAEARQQLQKKIAEWDAEDVIKEGESKLGALLYWRIYDPQ